MPLLSDLAQQLEQLERGSAVDEAVDGLLGQQDVVVKPLGSALVGVRGISGVTDLGNRRTILVLDVGAIVEEVLHGEGLAEVTHQSEPGM